MRLGAIAASVVLAWGLGLAIAAGMDYRKFFELVSLPISWGFLALVVIALAVLTKTDLAARFWARGADLSVDVPPYRDEGPKTSAEQQKLRRYYDDV